MAASSALSLDAAWLALRIVDVLQSTAVIIIMVVRRFQEIIGGRVYHIEASRVRDDRWRAQISRMPGTPTALMPFYGETADEAARQLFAWLTRAHRATSTTA
jgi:hypothetical protein